MKVLLGRDMIDPAKLIPIGKGGEGVVVKHASKPLAIKIYHKPTVERSNKLKAFFARNWNLPDTRIALPLEPAYNQKGDLIVGFSMPWLGDGFSHLGKLADKDERKRLGITTKFVTQVFLDGYPTLEAIGANGAAVGDMSDQNEGFIGPKMLYIDFDAYQWGGFPCPVATMDFVDPNLYNVDFSIAPRFSADTDWYSYAVLLFRSLLLAHPYSGNHKKVRKFTDRAQRRITVFDPDVIYPKVALSPDIFSDELADEFDKIFRLGRRGKFPLKVLQTYDQSLVECNSCGTWYPHSRKGCPVCKKRTIVVITQPVQTDKGVVAQRMFRANGDILYTRVLNNIAYVVTHDKDKVYLHKISPNGSVDSMFIMPVELGARYVIADDLLAVNIAGSEELRVFDVKGQTSKLILTTITDVFSMNRKAVFQATATRIIRMINGNISAIERGGLGVVERPVRYGIPHQTWLAANENYSGIQMFGLVQILSDQRFWYYIDGNSYEPKVSPMEVTETLLDLSVKFSTGSVILRRKTQLSGVNYLRVDIVDNIGNVTYSSTSPFEDSPVKAMHGQIYLGGVMLHPTDVGVVQQKVADNQIKTFSQTEPYVSEGDALFQFKKGLLVAGSDTLTYLELT